MMRVDVVVTAGPSVTRPAKAATVTIPIVMAFDSDPVMFPSKRARRDLWCGDHAKRTAL